LKFSFLMGGSLSILALLSGVVRATTLTTGTPANSLLATPTPADPQFDVTINFDELTPNTALTPNQYTAWGVTNISSPDGLQVIPFSTQTSPNEVYDPSLDGSANITINFASGQSQVAIGVADADPVTVFLQALDMNGNKLGSAFGVTLDSGSVNPFNGYFVVSDTSPDIFGLQITQPTGNANFSGLAIDDLQLAPAAQLTPEPATVALFGLGAVLVGLSRLRKRV
jgi:PEP-CTERM motif